MLLKSWNDVICLMHSHAVVDSSLVSWYLLQRPSSSHLLVYIREFIMQLIAILHVCLTIADKELNQVKSHDRAAILREKRI